MIAMALSVREIDGHLNVLDIRRSASINLGYPPSCSRSSALNAWVGAGRTARGRASPSGRAPLIF